MDGVFTAVFTVFDDDALTELGLDVNGSIGIAPLGTRPDDAYFVKVGLADTTNPGETALSLDLPDLPPTGTALVPHWNPWEPPLVAATLELVEHTTDGLREVGGGEMLTYVIVSPDGRELGLLDAATTRTR